MLRAFTLSQDQTQNYHTKVFKKNNISNNLKKIFQQLNILFNKNSLKSKD